MRIQTPAVVFVLALAIIFNLSYMDLTYVGTASLDGPLSVSHTINDTDFYGTCAGSTVYCGIRVNVATQAGSNPDKASVTVYKNGAQAAYVEFDLDVDETWSTDVTGTLGDQFTVEITPMTALGTGGSSGGSEASVEADLYVGYLD